MTEHPNLAAALAAFQAEMPVVPKGKTAKVTTKSGGSYSYTYAGLADVTEAAMPLLASHGLSFSCLPRMGERGFELVGRLLHTSGESVEGALPISGNTPQEMGSSLTYMRRYLLGCITGLVTDDDDDGALASRPQRKTAAPKAAASETGELASPAQVKRLNIALREAGHTTDADRYAWLSAGCRREITSSKQLTKAEASRAIDALGRKATSRAVEPSASEADLPDTEGDDA